MSKKTRKKSSKSGSSGATRGGSASAAKKSVAKTRPAAAKATKGTGKSNESSRKTQLKPAKASTARAAKPPARPEPVAAKPAAKKPARTSAQSATAKPAAAPSLLAEGAKAPAFDLPRDGGGSLSLSDFSGKNLVLFFYPRADTPGCTREAIDFTRLAGQFEAANTALLGVSADPPKAQEAFRSKHHLVTPLLSDEQHEILEAYGVWGEKSMYGRTFKGVVRTTVLLDGDGRVIRVWRNVKVDGHAEEVLGAVQAL